MLVEFGRGGWLDKARQQPDKAKMVLDKVRTDGLLPTLDAVRAKLDEPLPLGYCHVGTVVGVGEGVTGFEIGNRVASNAKHAEIVSVPVNLCVKVPHSVSDERASFTVISAIALQGIRLVQPTLGEAVVVTGLGLIGLLAVQLLRAHGCRVLGLDFDQRRLALAREFGAETVDLASGADPVTVARTFSRHRGVDAVLITAATRSDEPVHQAALMSRQRGRIVLVGIAGLDLSREDFFKKELTFQVSSSYGPGRYDPDYEERAQDYPIGFVRWTENRNFEAVMDMLTDGRIQIDQLISHRFDIADAEQAYAVIAGPEPSLGVLIQYNEDAAAPVCRTMVVSRTLLKRRSADVAASFIGSGSFATAVLIPAFMRAGAKPRRVASSVGVSAVHAARKFGFAEATTDPETLFDDPGTDIVAITTRHDSHAQYVVRALRAGKSAYVEKPLCLTMAELSLIEAIYAEESARRDGPPPRLMVGFNRRFAPHVARIKSLLFGGGPSDKAFVLTVNAGAIPPEHWTQDTAVGGGRIIGEACHFIDLLRYLADSAIADYRIARMNCRTRDTASIQLAFCDGSIGTIHYFANGSRRFAKERLEVFSNGRILQLDNYRRLRAFGWPAVASMNLWRQDKGHRACAAEFIRAVREGAAAPIPFEQIVEVSRATIELGGG